MKRYQFWGSAFLCVMMTAVLILSGCGESIVTTSPVTNVQAETTPDITQLIITETTSTQLVTTSATTPLQITTSTSITSITTITPTTGVLQIDCDCWGADITIGDKQVHLDASGRTEIKDLTPGTYTVKATRWDSQDWNKQVAIEAGKITVLYIYLVSNDGAMGISRDEIITPDSAGLYGTLFIDCDNWGVDTYINGESGGHIDAGTEKSITGLLPGTYTVKATRWDKHDWSKQVIIETGKTTVLYIYMESTSGVGGVSRNEIITPESVEEYGSLFVKCEWGVDIYIGGESGGYLDASGEITVNGLFPGTYTLKAIRWDADDWVGQVTIETGKTATIVIDLHHTWE
jgi:major membrane immunogen (membrane-anchored lipoprotein)